MTSMPIKSKSHTPTDFHHKKIMPPIERQIRIQAITFSKQTTNYRNFPGDTLHRIYHKHLQLCPQVADPHQALDSPSVPSMPTAPLGRGTSPQGTRHGLCANFKQPHKPKFTAPPIDAHFTLGSPTVHRCPPHPWLSHCPSTPTTPLALPPGELARSA